MDMMYLSLYFLVLRAMILYHIMILVSSLIINWCVKLVFYMHEIHDTTYDTSIVANLRNAVFGMKYDIHGQSRIVLHYFSL
jgi:hypothetical protein